MIKIFYPNSVGKIELTKEDLEKLLKEAYNEGYDKGRYYHNTYYSPYYCTTTLTGSADNCVSGRISSIDCGVDDSALASVEASANNLTDLTISAADKVAHQINNCSDEIIKISIKGAN